jgi:hypothetical protein
MKQERKEEKVRKRKEGGAKDIGCDILQFIESCGRFGGTCCLHFHDEM